MNRTFSWFFWYTNGRYEAQWTRSFLSSFEHPNGRYEAQWTQWTGPFRGSFDTQTADMRRNEHNEQDHSLVLLNTQTADMRRNGIPMNTMNRTFSWFFWHTNSRYEAQWTQWTRSFLSYFKHPNGRYEAQWTGLFFSFWTPETVDTSRNENNKQDHLLVFWTPETAVGLPVSRKKHWIFWLQI